MAHPSSTFPRRAAAPESCRRLRSELAGLADALVDARPADRSELWVRVCRAVDTERECGLEHEALSRLLRHMLTDLSEDVAAIDTLYYARQVAAQADRLPN